MSISATIGGVPVIVGNASLRLDDPLEDRSVLMFTVLDSSGTATYTRGDPVTFADPDVNLSYTGYVQSDQPTKDGLVLPYVEHVITCMDGVYNLGKRSNNQNYLNWQAGNIAVDFVRRDLGDEGITIAAAMHRDTTVSDFNQGNLNGLVGGINATDDGDLEIVKAGNAVTFTEQTTADFSSGTLTNVATTSNALSPTTVNAISMQTQMPTAQVGGYIYMTIWSGSMTVGTLDTLNYDVWVSSTSPAFGAGVDLNFSDGTSLHTYAGQVDQNFLPQSPTTDLSNYAKDAWYTRTISLTSAINGKTINSVCVAVAGSSSGTYTSFFKNIYLGSQSGSPFFSTSATTTQVNPPTMFANAGFFTTLTLISVVKALTGVNANRISPAHSIDAVKLIQSTFISWIASTPSGSGFQMAVSYDGTAFLPCTNNQPLPGLPSGSNVAGVSLYFMEIFSSGTAPTAIPSLDFVSVTLSPTANATKSDISANYGTSTAWNTGTLAGTTINAGGDLTLGTLVRDWNDGLMTNQVFFQQTDSSPVAVITTSVTSGRYTHATSSTGSYGVCVTRLDFAGDVANFVAEWDMTGTSATQINIGMQYRTIGWGPYADVFAYEMYCQVVAGGSIVLRKGTNDNNATTTGTPTLITSISQTFVSGTTYHFKLVVIGSTHQIFLNHATTPIISLTDTTFLTAGSFGFSTVFSGPGSAWIDNFTVTPSTYGTWQSASNSLAALSTISGSVISWLETLASGAASNKAIVQASIDAGASWQVCTNNATIPGLPAGTNVSTLSLLVRITLFSQTVVSSPVIGGLNWRVLGAFPSVTGTRDTAPLGNDTSITRTVGSGWGTAFDGQSWSQVGTGTTAVATGEETITNTTGDVHMVLGSRTYTDEEGTMRFALSASSIQAGIELRYTNANNYYRLAASTTALSIIKNTGGGNSTLATASVSLSAGTFYWMRFRVVGAGPVQLYGKIWQYNTLEPGVNLGILSSTSPQWTITASD